MEQGGSALSSVITALGTAFGTVQSDVMSVIGTVLPYALSILGAGIVVVLGVKVFKGIAKK